KLHSRYEEIENLQDNWMQALDDNYFPFVMLNFDYSTWETANPEFHKELLIKNFFSFSINDLNTHVAYYKHVKKSAVKLDSLIGEKLK
ncbi:MAG: hypothetical protein GY816_20895, partial [Cytophagales bacterium]|nr:hypothetical protein [Cytophagales bacterium]